MAEVKLSLKEMLAQKIAASAVKKEVPSNVQAALDAPELPVIEAHVEKVTDTKTINIVDNLKQQLTAVEQAKGKTIEELLDEPLGKSDATIAEEARIATADIVPRIRQLNSLSDMEAEKEMKLLKEALMANPEAVSLMLPEDVGSLVATLRRIVKEEVIASAAKKVKVSKKEPKVDAKTMWAVDADDF